MLTISSLHDLNRSLDNCGGCTTLQRNHRHVPGGGCIEQPDVMLVFINPTVHNITAHADWPGTRFPFAGKPKLWRILAEAGYVDPELPEQFARLGPTPELVDVLIEETRLRRLYLTNAVKCVDDGSNLPSTARVAMGWPILQREIDLVQPRHIIAFGLIPFRQLTGTQVRLADVLWDARQGRLAPYQSRPIDGRTYPVFPCYFPTGRGNPVGAARILHALRPIVLGQA